MYKFARPLSYKYSKLEEFVAQGSYLIGVGNTVTPWVVEGSPPEVDLSITTQSEVAVYLPSIEVLPVIPFPSESDETIQVGNKFYIPTGTTFSEISAAGATNVLIKAKLTHSQISSSVASYRSLAVHDQMLLTPAGTSAVEAGIGVSPAQVLDTRLVIITHIKPVTVQSNIIEFINLVFPI